MFKKLTLLFSLTLSISFLASNGVFAQVKKTVQQKPVTVKKATPQNKPAMVKPMIDPSTAGSVRVKIITDSGIVIVKLYDSTPLHRDNFVKLVEQGFYDSLMFHRVIPGFMIQGGDPLSKNAPAGTMLGNGGGDMQRIPAEFRKGLIHKKGALAAARDGNPEKASSACQFYLVEGNVVNDEMLNTMEQRKEMKYTAAQRSIYKSIGGTAFLDQDYTVFGEVESGLEVISKIANVPRDSNNRPTGDVRMRMELVK
jgi:cyclophilin family peptidyl-prolyl cis-trans isomerase